MFVFFFFKSLVFISSLMICHGVGVSVQHCIPSHYHESRLSILQPEMGCNGTDTRCQPVVLLISMRTVVNANAQNWVGQHIDSTVT